MAPNFMTLARGSTGTGTGNRDITDAGFGTPSAAVLITCYGYQNGTARDGASMSIGYATASADECINVHSEDNVSPSDAEREQDSVALALYDDSGSLDGQAGFGSFISDGIRLNISNAFSQDYPVNALLFKGCSNVDLRVVEVNAATVSPNIGFEPDLLIVSTADGSANNGATSFGFAYNGSSIEQGCVTIEIKNNQNPQSATDRTRDDYVAQQETDSTAIEVTAFGANGYTLTRREDSTTRDFIVLALKWTDPPEFKVMTVDSPNSTGNHAVTGVGFKPESYVIGIAASKTINEDRTVGTFGIYAANKDGDEGCHGISDDDEASPTNNESLTNNSFDFHDENGGSYYTGSHASMDSDGVTINFSAVDGGSHKWVGLFVEDTGDGGRIHDFMPFMSYR